MSFPDHVRESLVANGQIAAEVPCRIEGYREFVSVYAGSHDSILNSNARYPYLDEAKTLYRAIRFRVRSELIENDTNVGRNDLADLQEITLPSEDAVEFVMQIWRVPMEQLVSPKEVEIPV